MNYHQLVDRQLSPNTMDFGIPRISLNLREHKLAIAIHWTILFISSCVLPIVLYFALHYGAHLNLAITFAVTTSVFGVVSLFALAKRTWSLLRANSTCRPLGARRAAMDYFNWNFIGGFCAVTAVIVAGNVTQNVRVVALGLPILLIDVCSQLLVLSILSALGTKTPFRISSVPSGEPIRSGVYSIVEDIVAVDGGQGETYRRQLQDRYAASKPVRALFFQLDLIWGATGIAVGAIALGLIFGLADANVAYVLGWVIPWAYAGAMALICIQMSKNALKKEHDGKEVENLSEG